MIKDLFKVKKKYATVKLAEPKREPAPDGLWTKCESCGEIIYNKELKSNLWVCPKCNYHFKISAWERIQQIADEGSFVEIAGNVVSCDPLQFDGYKAKLERDASKTGLSEAVVACECTVGGHPAVLVVFDFRFRGGSMGSAVGERITRAIERAIELRRPVIIFSASGGARMEEGILSLMQMAKTSGVLSKLDREGLLYISVLTNPTTGGVFASFGSLGDIIIAEPGALIGFAGARVIEQTREKLPPGFQTAEFQLEHGMVDLIVDRRDMKSTLTTLLALHGQRSEARVG